FEYDPVLDATTKLLKHLTASSPLVVLFSGVSPPRDMVAAEVATIEAMGDGTTGDDGETGKELDDHSGDGSV
nr:hypothetical protein [Tanacetum cinerariifolium]